MSDLESRLRGREDLRRLDELTDATIRSGSKDVADYLRANSRAELDNVSQALPKLVEIANRTVRDSQQYGLIKSPLAVTRGIVIAAIMLHQRWQNVGDVNVTLTVDATPVTPVHVSLPATREFTFIPMLSEGRQILWGLESSGVAFSSKQLAEFMVDQVSDYYDEMRRKLDQR